MNPVYPQLDNLKKVPIIINFFLKFERFQGRIIFSPKSEKVSTIVFSISWFIYFFSNYLLAVFFKYFSTYWLPFVFLSAMLFLCAIAIGAKLRFSSECIVFLKFQVVYKHRMIYYKVESFQFMKFSGENFFTT